MKTRPDLVNRAIHHVVAGRNGGVGTIRVDAEQVEQLRYRVTPKASLGHTLTVDEPTVRGGTDQGPTPMEYFLTGALTSLLNQFVRLAMARGLAVETVKGSIQAHVHHVVEGGLSDVIFDVRVEGLITPGELRTLALDAERYCYAHVTLRRALPLTLHVFLNGAQVVDHTAGPTAAA